MVLGPCDVTLRGRGNERPGPPSQRSQMGQDSFPVPVGTRGPHPYFLCLTRPLQDDTKRDGSSTSHVALEGLPDNLVSNDPRCGPNPKSSRSLRRKDCSKT